MHGAKVLVKNVGNMEAAPFGRPKYGKKNGQTG